MKKVLIVSGHTDIQHGSVVNRRILEVVKRELPEVTIDSLSEHYPDFRIDTAAEQKKVVDADVIVWQFPLFWYAKPSLLQRWEEEVFTHGFSHGTNGKALQGKKLILSVTTGAPAEFYAREGRPTQRRTGRRAHARHAGYGQLDRHDARRSGGHHLRSLLCVPQ